MFPPLSDDDKQASTALDGMLRRNFNRLDQMWWSRDAPEASRPELGTKTLDVQPRKEGRKEGSLLSTQQQGGRWAVGGGEAWLCIRDTMHN